MTYIGRIGRAITGVLKLSDRVYSGILVLINNTPLGIVETIYTGMKYLIANSSNNHGDEVNYSILKTINHPIKEFSDGITHSHIKTLTTGREYSDSFSASTFDLFHTVRVFPETIIPTIIKTIIQPEYPDSITYSSTVGLAQSKNIEAITYTISYGVNNAYHVNDSITYTPSSGVNNAGHQSDIMTYALSYTLEPPHVVSSNVNYSFTLWTNQPTYTDKISHKFYLTLSQE